MNHDIPELDERGLRDFGLVTGGIFAALFGVIFPWLFNAAIPLWPWVLGGILATWGIVAPLSLGGVYRLWMKFGLLLSKIMTPIVLGIVFYLLILPIGFGMRLFGWDAMARRLDDGAASYRVVSVKAKKDNMARPF